MIAVLQLDSVSLRVLERLLAEGRMPTLAGLRERGRHVALQTPATHFAAGAFHTLYSGVELPDHGVFYPFQWSAPHQRARYMRSLDPPAPVWERLAAGAARRRTLAIDPYESRPPGRDVPGTLVCGWQLVDRVVLRGWSRPRDARRELGRLLGHPAHAEEIFGRPSPRELLRLRRTLVAGPGRVAELAEHLLATTSGGYDLAWITFVAAHIAGHQFWDLSQLDDERLEPGARRLLAEALDEVYVAVDRALARVLAALPDEADVIVTSPVGMDVNTSRADLLPEMLERVLSGRRDDPKAGGIWRLRAAVPASARGAVARALPDALTLGLTARLELRGIDWSATRAFAHPADNQGYVRLNLRGREREGIVSPAEADALCEEIAHGLRSFVDPDGQPTVARVERTGDLFGPGARAHRLPDLVVSFADRPATTLAGVESPEHGRIARRGGASGRSGNHTAGDAWALLVPATARHRDPGRPARLTDVAASVAALLDPDGPPMAGEPLLQPG